MKETYRGARCILATHQGRGVAAPEIIGETLDREMRRLYPSPNTPFDLQNWSFGISQDVNIGSATGGIGAGKVNFDPFKITKAIDKSSPHFFGTMCTGGHFEKATLMVRKSGAVADQSGGIYLQFDFLLVFVTNVSWSHSDPRPRKRSPSSTAPCKWATNSRRGRVN